jgi:2-phosphoglycerate kinase
VIRDCVGVGARALAARLDVASLSADDLFIVAKTFTTEKSHPGLHVMNVPNSVDYFTVSTVDKLTADSTEQHRAFWPALERVIRNRAASKSAIVIDGWFMRPKNIVELGLDNVTAFWLVADRDVLEERECRLDFFRGSANPEQMLQNFLGRSFWFNDLIRREATQLKQNILYEDGNTTVEALCDTAMNQLSREISYE